MEEAVDDHDVLKHYESGAALVEDWAPKKRKLPAEAVPHLQTSESECAVRERCRLRRLRRVERARARQMTNLAALLAGGAASVAVCAHGALGHRWFMAQLRPVEFQPTKLWGDNDMAFRLFGAVWHIVTAVFLASAVTLYLVAFGVVEGRELLRFISIVFAVFLGVGLVYLAKRLDAMLRLFPQVVVASMLGVSVLAWLAST